MGCRARVWALILSAVLVVALAACGGGGHAPQAENGRISFGKWDPKLGDFRIWTAAADGSDEQPVVPQMSWMSDWAPGGRRLVFEDLRSIKTIAPDGRDARVLVDGLGYQGIPKWSATGAWIAFEGSREKPRDPVDIPQDFKRSVWVVRPHGQDLHRVTTEFDVEPVFSPDGSRLAFGHVTRPGPPEQAVQSVMVVGLDGTRRREIVPSTVGLQHVDWSPDGAWITYNTEPLLGVTEQPPGRGAIWAVHPDGTDRHILVPTAGRWVFFKPVWSPDGKRMLSGCNPYPGGGVDRLCVIDVKSGDVHLLVDHSQDRQPVNFPAWGASPK
jgi:Tol biopolymer transport system component